MRIVDPLLMELEMEAATTRRVLERVPEEKLSWQPHPKSMTLGQLALHVATTPGQVAEIASVDTFELGQFNRPQATSKKEVLDGLTQSVAKAKDMVGRIDDARAMATWTATKNGKVMMSVPRVGVLRTIMLNHWYHHRGQLTVYLRVLNVPLPSVYGPTADENPFA